jgi:hypothetical protein
LPVTRPQVPQREPYLGIADELRQYFPIHRLPRSDSASFEDFIGEYAWVGARNVETVTRKGDQLYLQGSWEDSATELLPEKADTPIIFQQLTLQSGRSFVTIL